jgi:hypothetical protein
MDNSSQTLKTPKTDINVINDILTTIHDSDEEITDKINDTAFITFKDKITSYDITDLYNQIKKCIDNNSVSMLNKNPAYKECFDFDELIYKYIPKSYIDAHDNETNQKGYIDESGWQQA